MSFIYSAFIENTQAAREWLESIGYTPVCGRKKTLEGYVDKRGIPCARNSCTLFNGFADKVKERFKNTEL